MAEWLLGDTFNLVGCLMTGDQLPTEEYTAMYFIIVDVVGGGAEVQADCICVVYLCVPACVIEGRDASSTPA